MEHQNRGAEALSADAERRARLVRIRTALRAGREPPGTELSRLTARGLPGYVLVRLTGASEARTVRLALAVERWKLSSREGAVLEKLMQGHSNKEIANALGCAEVTVERHITSTFRKSGTRSRTGLLMRVHA